MIASDLPEMDAECFFIAPIGEEGSEERNRSDGVLEFIVQKAAQELELTAVRGDQIAEPGQINLQVLDHILRAKVAVADLTDLNPNVFYELAVRHTAKLPVVLIADKACDIPFDIAQMRIILFDHTNLRSADSCRAQIVTHLRQALSGGNTESPISTTLDVLSMQVGSPAERNVAEIVTSMEEVTRTQREMLQKITQLGDSFSASSRVAESLERALMFTSRLRHFKMPDEVVHDLFELTSELQHGLRAIHEPGDFRTARRTPRIAAVSTATKAPSEDP
ncbi:hypothetical protein OHU07_17735 [Streptomyces phaeochromogenes]